MIVRSLALAALILCALWCALTASRPGGFAAPQSFPVHVVSPGPLPSLWVFLRAECPHCRRHLAALHGALAHLPRESRSRAGARTHVVGDPTWADPVLQLHPRSFQARMGSGPVPCTWWVDVDSSLGRVWQGPLDERAWDELLMRLLEETIP